MLFTIQLSVTIIKTIHKPFAFDGNMAVKYFLFHLAIIRMVIFCLLLQKVRYKMVHRIEPMI